MFAWYTLVPEMLCLYLGRSHGPSRPGCLIEAVCEQSLVHTRVGPSRTPCADESYVLRGGLVQDRHQGRVNGLRDRSDYLHRSSLFDFCRARGQRQLGEENVLGLEEKDNDKGGHRVLSARPFRNQHASAVRGGRRSLRPTARRDHQIVERDNDFLLLLDQIRPRRLDELACAFSRGLSGLRRSPLGNPTGCEKQP